MLYKTWCADLSSSALPLGHRPMGVARLGAQISNTSPKEFKRRGQRAALLRLTRFTSGARVHRNSASSLAEGNCHGAWGWRRKSGRPPKRNPCELRLLMWLTLKYRSGCREARSKAWRWKSGRPLKGKLASSNWLRGKRFGPATYRDSLCSHAAADQRYAALR